MVYQQPLLILTLAILVTKQQSHTINYTEKFNDTECNDGNSCPTWFTCNSEKGCECGSRYNNAILCDNNKLISAVSRCNCVTYDEVNNFTFVGSCPYNCAFFYSKQDEIHLCYQYLPSKPEMLTNSSACTQFLRTGLLCGDCEEGYSPLVHSYNLSCVECPGGHKNWWKFMLATFIPVTLFYLFVVIFKINVASSRLHGVVFFCQVISAPSFVRTLLLQASTKGQLSVTLVKIILVFYSCWSLDLFHSVVPDICLNVTTLQALALEYFIALYPFLLILVSYFFIELYDRNFRLIVAAWKPFQKLLAILHRSWDIRTTVLDSFITFLTLSHAKVLCITSDILIPTQVYRLGSETAEHVVYYSPSVVYFGSYHLPYAILALTILIIVSIPHIILVVYPCKFFQKSLLLFPLNWHFLHALVDSVQGYYKYGTEEGKLDRRWFLSLTWLFYHILLILFAITLSEMYFMYATITVLVSMIALINIQPYKKVAFLLAWTDLISLFLLSLLYIIIPVDLYIGLNTYTTHHTFVSLTLYSVMIAPIVYSIWLICSWFVFKRR